MLDRHNIANTLAPIPAVQRTSSLLYTSVPCMPCHSSPCSALDLAEHTYSSTLVAHDSSTRVRQVTSPRTGISTLSISPVYVPVSTSHPFTSHRVSARGRGLVSSLQDRQRLRPCNLARLPPRPSLAPIVCRMRICRRTDRIVFQHRKRPVRAGPSEGSVVAF